MIVISGANGQLGRQVVEQLLERVGAEQLGVSVRDPAQAQDLAERGVRVRRGDYTDPASMADAFAGASRVLVVSANAVGEPARALNRTAIDAAAASGASRILYTSHVGAEPVSPFPPMPTHAASEELLRATGVPFTALRNGFYANFVPVMLGDALQTGELRAPEDGPVSYTAHADLAEGAAIALTDPDLDVELLPLTASEAVDLEGVAVLLTELTGRTIRRVVVPDAEHRAGLAARGMPDERLAIAMGMFEAAREGRFAHVDPTLERLLGRASTPLREVLREAVAA